MRPVVSILLAIVLAAGSAFAAWKLIQSRPLPEKVEIELPPLVVEVQRVEFKSHDISVPSQGMVEPVRESRLAAETGGRVITISPRFEPGLSVGKGEVLVEIDPADHIAALAEARARTADARLALESEEAAAAQARRDWERLSGPGTEPPPLAARLPQLEAARARLAAAEAAGQLAATNLERTRIRAPYDARIRSREADLGNMLAPGSPVGELFAAGRFRVRLPVPLDQAALLPPADPESGPDVRLAWSQGRASGEWTGRITRSEADVDRATRTVFQVAEIDVPDEASGVLAPGLFVQASIRGRTLENVAKLPRRALTRPDQVLVLSPEGTLGFRTIDIVYGDREHVYVASGLEQGEMVSLTTVESVIDGKTTAIPEEPDGESSGGA